MTQCCDALQYMHSKHVVHRDLKSQNIFLTEAGMVKLGDFGIACVLDNTAAMTRTTIGTPSHLSPEVCDGKPYGTKADIWSLGVVFYELLALKLPFQATSIASLVVKICSTEPKPLPTHSYGDELPKLVRHMLRKQPQQRPTASEANENLNTDKAASDVLEVTHRLVVKRRPASGRKTSLNKRLSLPAARREKRVLPPVPCALCDCRNTQSMTTLRPEEINARERRHSCNTPCPCNQFHDNVACLPYRLPCIRHHQWRSRSRDPAPTTKHKRSLTIDIMDAQRQQQPSALQTDIHPSASDDKLHACLGSCVSDAVRSRRTRSSSSSRCSSVCAGMGSRASSSSSTLSTAVKGSVTCHRVLSSCSRTATPPVSAR